MSQEFQHQQEVPGQQTAGASQYGGTTGTEMGGQTGQQAGPQMGHQAGMQMGGQGMGQEIGLRLSDVETSQQRAAVEDISRAIQVCGFCADQCIQEADPGMTECIRLCEDVTELGETVLALLPRSSRFTEEILMTFQQAIDECARECGQHPHAHCQECAEELGYTFESVQELLGTYGQQGGLYGQQGGTVQQTTTW